MCGGVGRAAPWRSAESKCALRSRHSQANLLGGFAVTRASADSEHGAGRRTPSTVNLTVNSEGRDAAAAGCSRLGRPAAERSRSPGPGPRHGQPAGPRHGRRERWPQSAASPFLVVSKSLLCSAQIFFHLPLSYKLFLAFFSFGRQPRKFWFFAV